MGLLVLYMGKVTRVQKKLLGSAVFLKLVRNPVVSDPACAENRVGISWVTLASTQEQSSSYEIPSILFLFIRTLHNILISKENIFF